MPKLKILADGISDQAKSQARGKLFETLMKTVLASHGYQIDAIPNVNYSGMEIDIEGKASIAGTPLYAECKCYDTEVGAPHFQRFFGKYTSRWFLDEHCHGLFVAIPGINSHAKAFYRDNCEKNQRITLRVLEEQQVLETMYTSKIIVRPEEFSKVLEPKAGQLGDYSILYTERGCFGVQYVIPFGVTLPNSVAIFDSLGRHVSTTDVVDYLTDIHPELKDFNIISTTAYGNKTSALVERHKEQIVEVRGSSACFEYQFPASPEYFVGRDAGLGQLQSFANQVLTKQTTSRGIVFEGNSGWGKSSLVLASVHTLQQLGHLAVAIDSRTASSSQFIMRAVDHVLNVFQQNHVSLDRRVHQGPLTGFDGAIDELLRFGRNLESQNRILFIFFDQFENIFTLPETAARVRDVFVKTLDVQTNVVLGFSWKTDLIGYTNDFPYQIRDAIATGSQHIRLGPFSEAESTALLDRLGNELRTPVRKDLRFFLSEFSQGYPWLLKKLCAHVKLQREQGVSQQNIVDSLLNVEQLFQDDMTGLSAEQEETLRRIARLAPVSVSEIAEEFKPEVIQSLVDARLVVRVGPMYDIYWDIFRDYLNGGVLPVQENYILHSSAPLIFKNCKVVAEHGGQLDVGEFREQAGLKSKAFYNVVREMRLLGLATSKDDHVTLEIPVPNAEKEFEDIFREHLREKLRRNRLISKMLAQLENEGTLTIEQVVGLLQSECPYISANQATWNLYARVFGGWMQIADLATYDKKSAQIEYYSPGNVLRQSNILESRNRSDVTLPPVQYGAIEKVSIRLVDAVDGTKRVNWSGIAPSTQSKALSALEQLKLIRRRPGLITVTSQLRDFVTDPEIRPTLFAERAMGIPVFELFVKILNKYQSEGSSMKDIGRELMVALEMGWQDSTAEANAKVMLNWARNAGLAPGAFATRRRVTPGHADESPSGDSKC